MSDTVIRRLEGAGSKALLNQYLGERHYLGPLAGWKLILVATDGADPRGGISSWMGVIVLGSPCSKVYGESVLEVRRMALSPGSGAAVSSLLLAAAKGWAFGGGFASILAYADPGAPADKPCPGNGDGSFWSGAGFESRGQTRIRRADEKGANRKVTAGSRSRWVWSVPT